MGMKSPLPFRSLTGYRAAQRGREERVDGMLESKAASRYFLSRKGCLCLLNNQSMPDISGHFADHVYQS